jgi:alpha-D-ribose 1-methylphosphonate 5-triphosphate diphosphatase PhnM
MNDDIILVDGLIVMEEDILAGHSLAIRDGQIADITSEYINSKNTIDCNGKYILPGLIDIHNDSIEDLIVPPKGVIFDYNVICSDYYSPAMISSIFNLANTASLTLPEAVKLATINPARAVKIDTEYGSIAIGKQADIIVVEPSCTQYKVRMVFVDGIKKVEYRY